MSYLNFLLFICVFSALSLNTYSQTDSDEIDDDKDTTTQVVQINKIIPRKRGIYKTYEEYVSNSPSVEAEFTLTPLRLSRNSPLIAEAEVDYRGKRPKKIWGVSDGEHVYVRMMLGTFYKNHYFRLQCDGPSPFIYVVEKPVFIATGLGIVAMASVAATSAALPPFVSLFIVRDNTNYFKPVLIANNSRVKNYLKEFPDLLEAYGNERKHNKATKVRYLTEYNNRKLKTKV